MAQQKKKNLMGMPKDEICKTIEKTVGTYRVVGILFCIRYPLLLCAFGRLAHGIPAV